MVLLLIEYLILLKIFVMKIIVIYDTNNIYNNNYKDLMNN